MTIKNLLLMYQENINNDNIFDVYQIIAFCLKKDLSYVIAYSNNKIDKNTLNKINNYLDKYFNNYPLAYILKQANFYNLDLYLNENVLIPRPETEKIIDLSQEILKKNKQIKTIIDLGTGSGAIILSLLNNNKKNKNLKFFGLDISKKALYIAKKNAKNLNLNNNLFLKKSNLLSNFKDFSKYNLLIANLPYLNKKEIKEASILSEPRLALYGGEDGLSLYKKLFIKISKLKYNFDIIIEINPKQVNSTKQLIQDILKVKNYKIIKDFRALNRFIYIKYHI